MDTLAVEPPTPSPTTTRAEFEASLAELQSIEPKENTTTDPFQAHEPVMSPFPAQVELSKSPELCKEPEIIDGLSNSSRKGHERSRSESERPTSRLSTRSRASTTSRTSRTTETTSNNKKSPVDASKRRSMPPVTTKTRRESMSTNKPTTPTIRSSTVSKPVTKPNIGSTKTTTVKSTTPTSRASTISSRSGAITPANVKGTTRPATPAIKSPTMARTLPSNRTPVTPTTYHITRSGSITSATGSPSKRMVPNSPTLSSSARSRVADRVAAFEKKPTGSTTTRSPTPGTNKLAMELAELKMKSEEVGKLLVEKEALLSKRDVELHILRRKFLDMNTIPKDHSKSSFTPLVNHPLQESEYEQELVYLKNDYAEELEKWKSEYKIELDSLKSSKEAEIDTLVQKKLEIISGKEKEMKIISQQILDLTLELETLRNDHQEVLQALKEQHQTEIQELKISHQADIDALRQDKDDQYKESLEETRCKLQVAQQRFEEELIVLKNLHAQELEGLKVHYEEGISSLKAHHEDNIQALVLEMEKLKIKHSEELQQVQNRLQHQVSHEDIQPHDSTIGELKSELESLKAQHIQELQDLHDTHELEVSKKLKEQQICSLEELRNQMDELKMQNSREIERLVNSHNTEMTALRSQHEDDINVVKSKLQSTIEQHQEDINSFKLSQQSEPKDIDSSEVSSESIEKLKAFYVDKSERLTEMHQMNITQVMKELEELKASQIHELESTKSFHDSEISSLKATHDVAIEKLKSEMDSLKADHAHELEAVQSEHEKVLRLARAPVEVLTKQIEENINDLEILKISHDEELTSLRESHASEVQKLAQDFEALALQSKHESDIDAHRFKTLSEELETLKIKHSEEILHLQNQHSEEMSLLREEQQVAFTNIESEKEQLLQQYQLKSSELEAIINEHSLELQVVQAAHKNELERIHFEMEALRSSALKQKHDRNHNDILIADMTAQLENMRSKHIDDLEALRIAHAKEIELLEHNQLAQDAELESIKALHQSELESLHKTHKTEVDGLYQSLKDFETSSLSKDHELEVSKAEIDRLTSLMEVIKIQSKIELEELHKMQQSFVAEITQEKADISEKLQRISAELDDRKKLYEEQLVVLRSDHQCEMEDLVHKLESFTNDEVSNQNARDSYEKEIQRLTVDIDSLKKMQEKQLELFRVEYDSSLDKLQKEKNEAVLEAEDQMDKLNSTKHEYEQQLQSLHQLHKTEVQLLNHNLKSYEAAQLDCEQLMLNQKEAMEKLASELNDRHAEEIKDLHTQWQVALNTIDIQKRDTLQNSEEFTFRISSLEVIHESQLTALKDELRLLQEKSFRHDELDAEIARLSGELEIVNVKHSKQLETVRKEFEELITELRLQNEELVQKVQLGDAEMASLTISYEEKLQSLRDSHADAITLLKDELEQSRDEASNAHEESESNTKEISSLNAKVKFLHAQHLSSLKEREEHDKEAEYSLQDKIDDSVTSALKELQIKHEQELEKLQENHTLELLNAESVMQDSVSKTVELDQVKKELEAVRQKSISELQGMETRYIELMEKSRAAVETQMSAKSDELKVLDSTISRLEEDRIFLQKEVEEVRGQIEHLEKQHESELDQVRLNHLTEISAKEDEISRAQTRFQQEITDATTLVEQRFSVQLEKARKALEEERVAHFTVKEQLAVLSNTEQQMKTIANKHKDDLERMEFAYTYQLGNKDKEIEAMRRQLYDLTGPHQHEETQFKSRDEEDLSSLGAIRRRESEENECLISSDVSEPKADNENLEVDSLFHFELITLL